MGGHEDGFRSGVDAAEQLLAKLPTLSRSAEQGRSGFAVDMGNADQSQGG
jgi:predicted NAD/FAD-binding protein